jgi:glycosyltransferase involved in cell wall biosynthesis
MTKVAVITPYAGEELEIIKLCHESVVNQDHECLHVLIGDGSPQEDINNWNAHHIVLPEKHNNIGSTPRLIGSYHAIGLGFDVIAYLDADNWYRQDHIRSIVEVVRRDGPGFVSTGRMLCRLDGSPMRECPFTKPNSFVDTNCMAFTKKSFHLLHHWALMPDYCHLIGDRVMLHHIKRSMIIHRHIPIPTVYYRCKRDRVYQILGERVPQGALPAPDYGNSIRKWIEDGRP